MTNIINHILENSKNEVIYEVEVLENGNLNLSVDQTEDVFNVKEIFRGVASEETLDDNLKIVTKEKEILTNIIEIAGEYFKIEDYMLYGTTCSWCEISKVNKEDIKAMTYTPLHVLKRELKFY